MFVGNRDVLVQRQGGSGQVGETLAVDGVARVRVGGVSLEQRQRVLQAVILHRVLRQVLGESDGDGLIRGFQSPPPLGPGINERLPFQNVAAVRLKGQLGCAIGLVGAVANEDALAGGRARFRGRAVRPVAAVI